MIDKAKQESATDQFGGETIEQLPEGQRTVANFRQQLDKRDSEYKTLLPPHIPIERLKAVATEAARQNPALLQCEPRSLLGAVSKAAKDWLMPDGREGVITPYRTRQRDGGTLLLAQWNPMVLGLRKRALELDGIIVQAECVYAKDPEFTFEVTSEATVLRHRPAPLGQERGEIIGAYAIFRRGREALHHEVMDYRDIENTRKQSRDPDSLMWSRFKGEGYKKTVVRRGFKSLPAKSPTLEDIVRREDEAFDFPDKVVPLPIAHQPEPEPEPAKPARKRKAKAKEAPASKPAKEAPAPSAKPAKAAKEQPSRSVLEIRTKMFSAFTPEALQRVWAEHVEPKQWSEKERAQLQKTFDERMGYMQ